MSLGAFIPVGAREVVPAAWSLIEDADSNLPEALRPIFGEACREICEIEARVKQVERQLDAIALFHPRIRILLSDNAIREAADRSRAMADVVAWAGL